MMIEAGMAVWGNGDACDVLSSPGASAMVGAIARWHQGNASLLGLVFS